VSTGGILVVFVVLRWYSSFTWNLITIMIIMIVNIPWRILSIDDSGSRLTVIYFIGTTSTSARGNMIAWNISSI